MRLLLALLLAATCTLSFAEALHAPSRSVYKCTAHGRTVYSDAPCLGAERLEIEPSRGVGNRAGSDVQREHQREMLAEALRPLTGKDARQMDIHNRRQKLPVESRRECHVLDLAIPQAEKKERHAAQREHAPIRTDLFTLRQRHRALHC